MTVTMTRTAVIAALEKNLAIAKREDAKQKLAHDRDEVKALREFRQIAKNAQTWDYKKLKRMRFEAALPYRHQPRCPRAHSEPIVVAIRSVNLDSRDRNFTVRPNSDLYNAVFWLPPSKMPKKSICED